MTEVHFYTGVTDKTLFACNLVKKAVERGRKVVVYASDAQALARFDQALWTFDPISFVPHVQASDPLAARTPVVLARDGDTESDTPGMPHHEVLINLDAQWPKFFSRFDFLMEIVGEADDDQAAGRARWKFYKERGYKLEHHGAR
jgi:DNA polymerase III subunit chi